MEKKIEQVPCGWCNAFHPEHTAFELNKGEEHSPADAAHLILEHTDRWEATGSVRRSYSPFLEAS